jgi:hypothetical protein|tara:strand:+ start:590 stop:760 length:171 start_codon:yes stop_codon:yes gene_type:complete
MYLLVNPTSGSMETISTIRAPTYIFAFLPSTEAHPAIVASHASREQLVVFRGKAIL